MIVLDKDIIMLLIDDVLQPMLEQRLVEVLMDLLDDDFLLSKSLFLYKREKKTREKFTSITTGSEKSYLCILLDIIGPSCMLNDSKSNLPAFSNNIRSRSI
jgi:hypothetical protein